MILFPAIDLVNGKAVRLFRGDYGKMTVYAEHPESVALDFGNEGAEAIHIAESQDVFGIDRDPEAEKAFISHEFMIYLLRIALKNEDAFLSFENWMLTEGLAEYYLQKIDSNSRSFQSCQEQAEVYRQLESTCGTDAVMLYRAALKR